MKSKIIKAAFLSFVVTNICTLSACSQNDVPQPNGSRVAVNFSSSASQLESSYAAARPDLIDGRQHSVFDDKKAADNKPVKTAAKAKKDKKAAANDSALASKLSSLGSAAQSYSDAVDKTDGRDVFIGKVEGSAHARFEVPRHDLRACAAANHLFPLFR